jgi:G3E family GTPase
MFVRAVAFSFETDNGRTLYDIARIDTMVTVVDAFNFYKELSSIETHQEVKASGGEQKMQEIPIAQLYIDQVEFANVIVINKIDLVSPDQVKSVEELIKRLNPTAEILHSDHSKIPLNRIIMANKFNFEEAQSTTKWIEELAKAPGSSEVDEYGFSSFTFKSRKPFNPEKLKELMSNDASVLFKDVVRGKGYMWLATNMQMCVSMNIVSGVCVLEPETIWWAAIKRSKWAEDKKGIDAIKRMLKDVWQAPYGDRRNELVFIGKNVNKEEILQQLNACLLTDEEMQHDDTEWKGMFKDTFKKFVKAVETHPMRENFKHVEGEWEECDTEEESDWDLDVTKDQETTKSTNTSASINEENEEKDKKDEAVAAAGDDDEKVRRLSGNSKKSPKRAKPDESDKKN